MVHLRELKIEDAEKMYEWMQDRDIQKCFQYDMAGQTLEDAKRFIRENKLPEYNEEKELHGKSIHYAIVNGEDEYLGTISLKEIDIKNLHAEFSISMRKMAQGTGASVEAVEQLLGFAFKELHLEKVYLNVLEENQKAVRFYEKMGFVYEGTARSHIMIKRGQEIELKTLKWYGMLREEFSLTEKDFKQE